MAMNTRIKIFYVSWELLTRLILGLWNNDFLSLPNFDVIPPNAKCERMFMSPERAAVGFVISSASFEKVKPGQIAPEINIKNITVKKVRVKRKES